MLFKEVLNLDEVWAQVEELRADLSDVKQMYREQIDMLVGQVHSASFLERNGSRVFLSCNRSSSLKIVFVCFELELSAANKESSNHMTSSQIKEFGPCWVGVYLWDMGEIPWTSSCNFKN